MTPTGYESRIRDKYRRLDGVIVEPVSRPEKINTSVMGQLQNYSTWFEPASLRTLEQRQEHAETTGQKLPAIVMVMGAEDFKRRYEQRLRPGIFHHGTYSVLTTDRDGIQYPGLIFDTHLGSGVGVSYGSSGIVCAAYTPEGVASLQIFRTPDTLPDPKHMSAMPEIKTLKRFLTKYFAHGGGLFFLGSDEQKERGYVDSLQSTLTFPHIPSNRLLIQHEHPESSHVQAVFFFPGKAVGESENQLILVGDHAPGNESVRWLREMFYTA